MRNFPKLATFLLIAWAMPGLASADEASAGGENHAKAILVTGASTGIGRNITETLAAKGYFVYAGARKEKDLAELNAIENVQAVRLDVTVQEEIDAAVETVRKGGRGLYGLVNNAGVAIVGSLIEVEEDELDFQLDVNVFGPYRVTKAFAPLIMESKGRITTIGSISGILSGPLFGPYSMSKHAIEAYTDSLAREMADFDVQVSVIEPGNYKSDIFKSLRRRMERNGQSIDDSLFAEQIKRMLEAPVDRAQHKEPDEVSAAVMDALFADDPKHRYMVVPNEFEAQITITQIMREMVQLNEGQPYTYDREALIAIMDGVLAELDE
ncbi:MAG: SDR family oxidoreductase [Gammaproteobacteria bacterium]|nr:SDR family oxidoreductase [Gammaproteobacteria bacterium]